MKVSVPVSDRHHPPPPSFLVRRIHDPLFLTTPLVSKQKQSWYPRNYCSQKRSRYHGSFTSRIKQVTYLLTIDWAFSPKCRYFSLISMYGLFVLVIVLNSLWDILSLNTISFLPERPQRKSNTEVKTKSLRILYNSYSISNIITF